MFNGILASTHEIPATSLPSHDSQKLSPDLAKCYLAGVGGRGSVKNKPQLRTMECQVKASSYKEGSDRNA